MTLTPEQLAKSREEFEEWILSVGGNINKSSSGVYVLLDTRTKWEAWQARLISLAEPTKEMVIAGINAHHKGAADLNDWDYIKNIYKAMISCNPQA